MMYNPQLDTFLKVADVGSFNKAAAELYISPPAVSSKSSSLNLRLFERTPRGLKLTKAGESLYADVKYIISYCHASVERAGQAPQEQPSVIRVGTSPMTPGQILIDMWQKIHEIEPDMKIQLVPFENTPENAKEILNHLGQNIDIVAGVYDEKSLKLWKCVGMFLSDEPVRCAVSVYHRLAQKEKLQITDLYGETFMMIHRGWNENTDCLRSDLIQNHPEIRIEDFDFFSLSVFNQCENSNSLLMCIDNWSNTHPLLKVLPVEWNYTMKFGLLHAPKPSLEVKIFLKAVQQVAKNPDLTNNNRKV